METRKILALLLVMFAPLICYSQTRIQSRDVKRISGKAYLLSKGNQYEIREGVVLAKLKEGKKQVKDNIIVLKTHSFGMIEIAVPDSVAVEDYVKVLDKTDDFECVEFDTYVNPCMSANDTYYSDQWGPGHIHADAAWEITTGSPSIKVAVIDSDGFELSHPDLYYGNDNYSNLNVLEYSDFISPTNHTPSGPHGTMVAGIIGAKTNNGTGIAGIAGGNNCAGSKIVPYRLTTASQCIQAIYDAVLKEVSIINMSFDTSESSNFNAAITWAYNNGVTIVCSTGNNSSSQVVYPASHEYTIAVGSIDASNYRWITSNYGSGLDLVAPGVSIKSTSTSGNNYYKEDSGTSLAAPHVSGVIALMLSVNPDLTPDNIKYILESTATRIRPETYTYNSNGWNYEVGYGLVNACKAVMAAMNMSISGPSSLCNPSPAIYTISNLPSTYTVFWSMSNDDFNRMSLGNQCIVTYIGTQPYAKTELTARVFYNGLQINQFTKSIEIGVPDFWADLQITGGDGIQGRWTSNLIRNRVDIEELFDIPIHYYQFEANLYRMSDSDPYDTLVRHWFFNNRYAVMDYIPQGWYLLQVRGVNSCGVSEWLEVEIECIDTYMPHANDDETVMSFMYNKQGQILTVTINHATASSQKTASLAQSRSTMGNTCVLQLWNESRLVKEYNSKASIVQIPMAGLKNGVYTIRYVNKDKVIAKKFVKP